MTDYEKNEKLRELCSLGDLNLVKGFYEKEKPDVNSKNKINGWSALHWAAKRNHFEIVNYLLEKGASIENKNIDGKAAGYYTTDQKIKNLLILDFNDESYNRKSSDDSKSNLFKPNYLSNPEFHYANANLYSSYSASSISNEKNLDSNSKLIDKEDNTMKSITQSYSSNQIITNDSENKSEIITIRLKANTDEDFIEIDIDKLNISFERFKEICLKELEHVDKKLRILKIRKLPNILIRNTNDIKRLKNEQEIQFILV